MKIVIPSHKRHESVSTTKVVEDACIVIPKSQEYLYKEHNPDVEIICHPDDVIGISPKRQWILDKFGDVFMLDDDIIALRRTYLSTGDKKDKLSKEDATGILYDTYFMLKEQTNIKYFGFAKSPSPLHYDVSKPIVLNGFIQGCAMGVISGGNLHYPLVSNQLGEDEYICLLNAYYNRKMWIDKRFFFEFKTNNIDIGGCEDIRNDKSTINSYLNLKKHFGDAIVQDKKSKKLRWRTKIPY